MYLNNPFTSIVLCDIAQRIAVVEPTHSIAARCDIQIICAIFHRLSCMKVYTNLNTFYLEKNAHDPMVIQLALIFAARRICIAFSESVRLLTDRHWFQPTRNPRSTSQNR